MEEKRPTKGITIFAWVMIIFNIFVLLYSLDFKNNFFEIYKSFNKNFIIVMILYSILSATAGIIVSFGLLKLKDIMRRIGIAVNSIDLLFGIPLFFLTLNDIKNYSYLVAASELARKPTNLTIDMLGNIAFYITVFTVGIIFGLNLLFIFFFTRPKVKEQFK